MLMMFSTLASAQPYIPSSSTEPSRSGIISYPSANGVMTGVPETSASYIYLNGEWRVKYFEKPSDVLLLDLSKANDMKSWGRSVKLPSLWQIDRGESVVYSKDGYPFLSSEPQRGDFTIPEGSFTALYQRDFTVTFDHSDKKQYLNIGGVLGKVTLYINGEEVGHSTDGRNPAEFEISKFTQRGLNRISLLVEQFSEGSWLDGISGWKLSGVNRDIYILVQPKIRVRDVLVTTSLDPTYTNGMLKTALLLKSELLNPHTVTVNYNLYDPKGNIIRKQSKDVSIGGRGEDTVHFHSSLLGVERWNSETPNLYTVVYSIKRDTRYTEFISYRVGFRKVEVSDGALLLNGVPFVVKGVNFEEFSAERGNILSREEMKAELFAIRQSGFNSIRTSGHPMPQYFYDLTDSIGFFVVSVAGVNTSGLRNSTQKGYSLSNDPEWSEIFTQRIVSTYERTKRNASVIAVALGEDAGNGYNMYEAYLELKRRDPELIVMYDGAGAQWNTDIICPLYPEAKDIIDLENREIIQPLIPSRVDFDVRYWSDIALQGAFLSRWKPRELNIKGGAQYEMLSDNYTREPLVSGNITERSVQDNLAEISDFFASFMVLSLGGEGPIIRIINNMQFSNLSELDFSYRTITKGRYSKWRTMTIDCGAGGAVDVVLEKTAKADSIEVKIGSIYTTTVEL